VDRAPTNRRHLGRPRVIAVVHAREAEHLPAVLAAVAAQSRRPDLLIGIDAASTPAAAEADQDQDQDQDQEHEQVGPVLAPLLAHADEVLRLDPAAGQADGVAAALRWLEVHELRPCPAPRAEPEPRTGGPAPVQDWVWLLDDRDRPSMRALQNLLELVQSSENVAVAGMKHRTGPTGAVLLDAGFTTTRWGRRLSRVEPGEVDQGQLDATSDVLAVDLSGMLVRREVWELLRGADPAVSRPGRHGADLDLCRRARLAGSRVASVPSAVMTRPGTAAPLVQDRRSRAHLRLTAASGWALPFVVVSVLLGAGARVLMGIARKEPRAGLSAAGSTLTALLRPDQVWRARREAARTRRVPRSQLLPLLAGPRETARWHRDRWQGRSGAVPVGWGVPRRATPLVDAGRRTGELEGGDTFPSEADQPRPGRFAVPAVVAAMLAVVAAVAMGRILGPGQVTSASLAPAPEAVGALWSSARSSWAAFGLGNPGSADPALWPLLLLSLPFASPSTALTVLLLLALPAAGASAWWASGALTRSRRWRALAAVCWAATPALLLATSTGRWGAVLAHLALPVVARLLAHAATTEHRRVSWAWAAAASLALLPVTAGAPVLLLPAVLVGMAVAVGSCRLAPAFLAAPACALALPTLLEAVRFPALLVAGPGIPVASGRTAGWEPLLGWPSATAASEAWPGVSGSLVRVLEPLIGSGATGPAVLALPFVAAGVPVLGALLALPVAVRGSRRGAGARVGLLLAAAGLVVALVASRVQVGLDAAGSAVTGWTGPGASLAVLGLLLAGLSGATRPATGRRETDPSWRRRAAGGGALLVAALLLLLPVLGLAGWAGQQAIAAPVDAVRRTTGVLPAVVVDAAGSPDQVRSLVLAVDASGRQDPATAQDVPPLQVALVRGDGPGLDRIATSATVRQAWTRPGAGTDAADTALAEAVGALMTGRTDLRPGVAPFGVGAVVLLDGGTEQARAATEQVAARLDATVGLTPAGRTPTSRAWRVEAVGDGGADAADRPAAVRIMPSETETQAGEPGWRALPSASGAVDADVPAGPAGRVVALAERADPSWHATLDGQKLAPVTAGGWAQGFALPESSGHLVVVHEAASQRVIRIFAVVVVLLAVLLAVPVGRGRRLPRREGAS